MDDRERRRAFNKERKAVEQEFETLSAETLVMINRILNEAREQIKFLLRISPTEYNTWLLGELESQIKVIMDQVAGRSAAAAQAALTNAWALGELLTDRPLQAAGLTIAGVAPAIDTRQLTALQHVTTRSDEGAGLRHLLLGQMASRSTSETDGERQPKTGYRIGGHLSGSHAGEKRL